MAEENTIIQLSESSNKHATSNNAPGDWTTNVEDLTLYKGDVLQMRSCFIDTVSQNSGLIEVEPDEPGGDFMTLSISNGYYICDWGSTPTDIIPNADGSVLVPRGLVSGNRQFTTDPTNSNNPATRIGNGHQYINCQKKAIPTPGAGEPTVNLLSGISVRLTDETRGTAGPKAGRTGYYKYLAPGAGPNDWTKVTLVFNKVGELKSKGAKGGTPLYQKVDVTNQGTYLKYGKTFFPILISGNSFVPDITITPNNPVLNRGQTTKKEAQHNANQFSKDKLDPYPQLESAAVSSKSGIFAPNIYTQTFQLPARKYDPEELAVKISTILSKINKGNKADHETKATKFTDNFFLTTTDNLANNNFVDPLPDTPLDYDQYCNFVKDSGTEIVHKITGGVPLVPVTHREFMVNEFLGTGTVDLSFDANMFHFNRIHKSILDNEDNIVTISCSELVRNTDTNNEDPFRTVANKASGIFFTDLLPKNFWFKTLNLEESILVNLQYKTDTMTIDVAGTDYEYIVPKIPLIDGINITGDIVGLDGCYTKPSAGFVDWENAPDTLTQNINIVTQTIPIYGNSVFNNTDAQSGYYQIEIDAGINKSNIKGQDTNNNKIKAIISKFYAQNAYTSAYSEGSITYEHTSNEPIELSQFRIRVLDSTGQLVSLKEELGTDSTVFMEIIRGSNQAN